MQICSCPLNLTLTQPIETTTCIIIIPIITIDVDPFRISPSFVPFNAFLRARSHKPDERTNSWVEINFKIDGGRKWRKKVDGASDDSEFCGVFDFCGAGWLVSRQIHRWRAESPPPGWESFTIFLLIFALLAGTTGLCSVFQGYMQARVLNSVGLASAATSAIISWGFTALAFGLVCKQIIVGGHRGKRSQTLEAFIAISGLSQLLYLLLLHAHVFTADTDRLTKVKGTPKNSTTISKFTIFRVRTRSTFVPV